MFKPAVFGALACELLIDAEAQGSGMPPQLREHHQRGGWKHLAQLLCFPPGGVHHDEIGGQSLLLQLPAGFGHGMAPLLDRRLLDAIQAVAQIGETVPARVIFGR